MQVLIVRHAEAVDSRAAPTDAMRWLTAHGRTTATRVGGALTKLGIEYTRIFTSPLVRAVQTAELLASMQPRFSGPITVHPPLSTEEGTTAQALEPVYQATEDDVIMLVSHMPKVRSLAGHLCGVPAFPGFDACAACLIELDPAGGSFGWLMDPETGQVRRDL